MAVKADMTGCKTLFSMVFSSMEKENKILRGGCYDKKKRKIHEGNTNGGSGHIINDVVRFAKPIHHSSSCTSSNRFGCLLRR